MAASMCFLAVPTQSGEQYLHMISTAGVPLLDAPLETNLQAVAAWLGKRVESVVAVVLDRPRHETLIVELRRESCCIRLISDGDVASAVGPSLPDSGVDLYVGIGGGPEAVLAAAAVKCLGGEQLCRIWPRDNTERDALLALGYSQADLDRRRNGEGRAHHFRATGISDSSMLRGIRFGGRHCITESILMRARNHTVRRIEAWNAVERKTIRIGSSGEEVRL